MEHWERMKNCGWIVDFKKYIVVEELEVMASLAFTANFSHLMATLPS